MTWPGIGHPFTGLGLTEDELAAGLAVLDELAARDEQMAAEILDDLEADLGSLPDDGGGDDGMDGYGLANDYEMTDGLAQLDDLVDQQLAAENARHAQDMAGALAPRRSSEVRLAQAISRIEAGTYLPAGQFRDPAAARDAHGQFTGRACGPYDSGSGRCSARYHAAGCLEVARGEAATGSADAVLAWRRQLARNHAVTSTATLANTSAMDWDDQLGPEQPPAGAVLEYMRQALGVRPQAPLPGRPTAGGMARELGLY